MVNLDMMVNAFGLVDPDKDADARDLYIAHCFDIHIDPKSITGNHSVMRQIALVQAEAPHPLQKRTAEIIMKLRCHPSVASSTNWERRQGGKRQPANGGATGIDAIGFGGL